MSNDYKFQVNLKGMIELLSDHLYSSPNVYIRELLQNGVDAITGRERIDIEYKESKSARITITLKEGESLLFSDNGTGLTEEEIHKFLSVIGESSKRDIETGDILNEYIGRFGIGILSCFLVSDTITIITKSAKDGKSCIWKGNPDGTYTVEAYNEVIPTGTHVYLKCKRGCEKFFKEQRLKELIDYYGLILPYPIWLITDGAEELLNSVLLPWERTYASREEILDFGARQFGIDFFDYTLIQSEDGDISGVAYILPYSVSATTKQKHKLFLKNMLLTETAGDLIPDWAVFTKCILNARDLRPTASREEFYEDDKLKSARDNISQCLFKYIKEMASERNGLFMNFMNLHQFAVKSVACENEELYMTFIEYFTFHTTFGELTGKQLMQARQVLYCPQEKYRQLAQLFTAQEILLVNSSYVFDYTLLTMMSEYFDVNVLPVVDDEIGNILSDALPQEQERAAALVRVIRERLNEYGCDVAIKSFRPDTVSCFYTLNEDKEIYDQLMSMRDDDEYTLFGDMFGELSDEFETKASATLFLNADNQVIKQLITLVSEKPTPRNIKKAQQIICVLYVQTLLVGNFQMRNNELSLMNENLLGIIGATLK